MGGGAKTGRETRMIEFPLQQAIYTALSAASLGVQGVYDIAPQNADGGDGSVFPYVAMGRAVVTSLDTQTTNGFAAQIRIHTYSRSGSMKECKEIQGAIYSALHRQELSITGFNNFSLLRESTDCTPMGDGQLHGVCEYRALIESA
jgi:hypothetical protein